MDKRQTSNPSQPRSPAEQRQLRLEQQLRGNLQKRKAQARARREDVGTASPADNGDAEAQEALPLRPRSD